MNTKSRSAQFSAGDVEGTFEAIVSVFGNVDLQGDRIVPGAFAATLEAWEKSGDPIPVIWSHDWPDPMSHIGSVTAAHELEPGDERLPESLKHLGGLLVEGRIDLDNPKGAQTHRLMTERRVKEFSFAYDIVDAETVTTDEKSVYELRQIDLIEVGPTLKGANPATELVAAKNLDETAVRAVVEEVLAEREASPETEEPAEPAKVPSGISPASAGLLLDLHAQV